MILVVADPRAGKAWTAELRRAQFGTVLHLDSLEDAAAYSSPISLLLVEWPPPDPEAADAVRALIDGGQVRRALLIADGALYLREATALAHERPGKVEAVGGMDLAVVGKMLREG